MEISTRYDFKETEEKWLSYWQENNVFHAQAHPLKKPYSIVIPPPNVTGILHMGHALNNTLQDILIRYKRMKGFETCWMPGTDHAGIATQNVVEKQLAKEGKIRQEIGREEFTRRLWEWKNQYGNTILHQLKKLGASCDWARTRFTMDDEYSEAVKHVFVKLYQKGLIYQGKYIINWCPRCETALSDEESEHRDIQGGLYHIRYPFKDHEKEYLIVATTRPETMLGDTAVAVNPKDKRYKIFIGKTLILPLVNREIQIIADEFVDPEFGTGAVKVTPAHDPNDFEMGTRHNLEFVNILHPDGRLNENAGEFANMNRFEGREAILEALKQRKLLEKVDPHKHAVGHCYRCHDIVEPYLSKQWFVKMKPLAKPAVDVVKKGRVKFTPNRWSKVYLNWMENIRDWCISRQIWWGHRIPVWYCQDCQKVLVEMKVPTQCSQCQSKNLKQEEDVLDTWFSSWLWPFATFHWPEKNEDLHYFYPTSSLFTASEIIFFWVARMIMAGLEFMGEIPFSDVYIHGTVRDTKGIKMSKSLGNVIDPLEIIEQYGADALRFSLIVNSGQDLYISKEKFEIGRNFANKIWNGTRLVLMNVTEPREKLLEGQIKIKDLDLPNRWILSRFHETLGKTEKAIERYRFSEAETLIYDFFWKNFCDWYLEIIKDRFGEIQTQQAAIYILDHFLKILHPFMPFVSEELWHIVTEKEGSLAQEPWPKVERSLIDKKSVSQMNLIMDIVSCIRNIRAQWHIEKRTAIECVFVASQEKDREILEQYQALIIKLVNLKNITITMKSQKQKDSVTSLAQKIKIHIPLKGIVDIEKEKSSLKTQLESQKAALQSLSKRLKNKSFLTKAPKNVVEKERKRLDFLEVKLRTLKKTLSELK